MTWTPQPEHDPRPTQPRPGVVAGVWVCGFHVLTTINLRGQHTSPEGHARRVQQIAATCLDCLREQRENT